MQCTRICEYCGAQFVATNGMQKYCMGPHYRKCVICGNTFEIPNSQLNSKEIKQCCSKKCSRELRKQTNIEKYGGVSPASSAEIQAKMRATTLERYGVEHGAQSEVVKEKTRKTNLIKYGIENFLQSTKVKDKLKELRRDPEFQQRIKLARERTNIERYGVKCIFSDKNIYAKGRETLRKRTGYSYTWEDPEQFNQMKAQLFEKYQAEFPMQSRELRAKIVETNRLRYGTDNPMQNADIRKKVEATNLVRYGVANASAAESVKNKRLATMRERYGVNSSQLTPENLASRMSDPSKLQNLIEFHDGPLLYIENHFETQPTMSQLAKDIGISPTTLGQYLAAHQIRNAIAYVKSEIEREVHEFIQSISKGIRIEVDDRRQIRPLELDLYLPEYKFAIECNPTCTHNSSVADPWGGEAKSYRYHQQKTIACEEVGIQLFHVFSYEWEHKRDIIESMIKNRIGKCDKVIYARKCKVVEVSSGDAIRFLNANHRQGAAFSPIRLGLEHNGELVSLMTFGKMRNSIGTGKEELSNCYELVRFCSLLNTSVVGGASKLFKYFVKEYNPVQIRSFSDRAHTSGHLYPTLGFTEVRKSDPGYVWVDVVTDIAYHRSNAQKKNIKKFLRDDSIDLSKTEAEIMMEHGFVQVFDCGTITWEWQV